MAEVKVNVDFIKQQIEYRGRQAFYGAVLTKTDIDVEFPLQLLFGNKQKKGLTIRVLWAISKELNCSIESLLIIS